MRNLKKEYHGLTGPEKASILILALGENQTETIFSMMDDEEIKELSQVMSNLGTIEAQVVEDLFSDFHEQISSQGPILGTYDTTERLLSKVLGKDRVTAIMEEIRGPAGRTMWDKLNNVNENVLANYLKNEYPQTVGVVMTKLKPHHAAAVLNLLPESFSMEVILRMLTMESVQKEILDNIEETLKSEFMSNLIRGSRADNHELMADIFNAFDNKTQEQFLDSLSEQNTESAEKIKSLMFTFNDLSRIDPQGIQAILRNAPKEDIALALKGAPIQIKDVFTSNMSIRARKILDEDINALGAVRLSEVENAQQRVMLIAKELSEIGQISISKKNQEETMVS